MAPHEDRWVSVVDVLRRAQHSLGMGELLHVPHFTVDQAMTAIEIGDPRMDSGPDPSPELQTQLDSNQLQPDLSLTESAHLLDCLIGKLVQWWSGRSLQQTVYTSLHVLAHNRLDDFPVPRAIATLVLGLVSVSKGIIQDSGVVHDEDCSAYSVLPDEAQLTSSMARGIDTQVKTALDACKKSDTQDVAQALSVRLQFLQHLLTTLRQLKHASARSVDRASQASGAALKLLDSFPATATAIPDGEAPGVMPHLHRDASTLPPPEVPPLCREDADTYLRQLLSELKVLTHVQHVTSLRFALLLTQHVSRTCSVPIVRGLMFLLLSPVNIADESELPSWAPCSHHYLDALALPHSQRRRAPQLDVCVEQSHIAVSNYLQALCLNRPRVRRRLRTGVEDWQRMRVHAMNADNSEELATFLLQHGHWDLTPQPDITGPCSLWLGELALSAMTDFLLIGVELGLYDDHEYATVFWYSDRLFGRRMRLLNDFVSARPKALKVQAAKKSKEGKGSDKKSKAEPVLTDKEAKRMMREQLDMAVLEVKRLMSAATCWLAIALQAVGLNSAPDPAFGSAENRYLQRFESFQTYEDDLYVPCEDLLHKLRPGPDTPVKDLIGHPQEAYSKLVSKLEAVMLHIQHHSIPIFAWEVEELRDLSQAAKRNVMACRLLLAAAEKGTLLSFEAAWDFSHHWHFPALSLKRRT